MAKKLVLPLLLCFIAFYNLQSQGDPDYREIFLEAESYFLFEEYNEALPLYLRINNKFPENNNINYKIGVCYLNNSYEKENAISFLERAVTDINPEYKENNFKEKSAPLESLFHLGTAYRINNLIDKAIETYKKFGEQSDPAIYDHKLVDEQINACYNAIDLKTRPIDFDILNIGDRINTRFSDINPVVSGDETKMVYIQKQQFYDAVFFSEKIDGVWSIPRNIIPELGVDEDAYPTALSYDGNLLLIYRSDNFIGDLYYSTLSDGTWSKLVKLNDNINTKYWESHACLTRNNDTLYFTSNRKGGYGGLDIYFSTKDKSDQWTSPVNLGPVINTIYNEETPFITSDGNTLYFSSYGHYNMGGYDVFYTSLLEDGTWSVPINAGYPINTTEDDIFFVPVNNGIFAYFPRFLQDGIGRTDIYKLEIYSGTHPRKFMIKGLVSYPGEELVKNPVTVKVINYLTRDTVSLSNANLETGEFSFDVPAGQYDILIEGEDIQSATSSLLIPKDFRGKEIDLEKTIELALVEKPEELAQPQVVDKIKLVDEDGNLGYKDVVIVSNPEEAAPVIQKEKPPKKEVPARSESIAKPVIKKFPVPSQDTIDLVIKQIGTSYINSYLNQLTELTENEALKNTMSNLDPAKENISSLQELYDYLMKNTETGGYDAKDVNNLFTRLSLRTELVNLIENLNKLATGGLREALEDLDPKKENLRNPVDLMNYLLNNAEKYSYTESDALNLLFDYLEKEDLNEIMKILIGTASGPLQDLLTRLNLETSGIESIDELYKYLLTQAKYNNYNESDVIKLFLNLLNIMDKQELIKKIEPSQIPSIQVTTEKKSALVYYLSGAGLLIILLIIILLRRRKKNKQKQG